MPEAAHKRKVSCEDALEAVRKEHGVVVDAAARLDCDPSTIYRRANEDDRIWQAIEEEREGLVRRLKEVPKTIAFDPESSGNARLKAAFKLLNVFDEEHDWADRKRTDITSGGDPVTEINLNVVETDAEDFEREVRE